MGDLRRQAVALGLAAFLVSAVAVLPATAGTQVRTKLVSKTSGGDPANDASDEPSTSASGRFVAFQSDATNLPGGDFQDVYVRDLRRGRTKLISQTSGEDPADGLSVSPSISASGRLVAFASSADNLQGDDGFQDVYVRDRRTGRTKLVSKTSGGEAANGASAFPSISASGRFVAFASGADNLPGADGVFSVYVRDLERGRTRLVSKTSGGDPTTGGDSVSPSISASGRFIAFRSLATNLPSGGANPDIYVHDRRTGRTRLVSKTSGGDPADGANEGPSISGSGRFIAFDSNATNLRGDGRQVYVRDLERGKTRLVSKTSGGDPSDGFSEQASISASGRFVAFMSAAANLPGDHAGDIFNVYVHDRETGRTKLASRTNGGDPASGGDSEHPSLSARAGFVAFDSDATNLPGPGAFTQVYLRGPLR